MNAAIVTPEDDLTLLRAFATTRDETAFEAIAKRYGPMVLATARRQTRDPSRADDVAQAVFLILANKAASLDGRSLGAWLHRATLLTARNVNRVDARRLRHEQEAMMQRTARTVEAKDSDALIELDRALNALGRADREAIVLRYVDALSLAELADRLGLRPETAKKRLARALDRLRRRLGGHDATAALAAFAVPEATFTFHPTPTATAFAKGTLTMLTQATLLKIAVASTCGVAIVATLAVAATQPIAGAKPQSAGGNSSVTTTAVAPAATRQAASPIERAWNDLAESEPKASIALLTLSGDPVAFVAFAADHFPPLTLTEETLAEQLALLGSDDEATWQAASDVLRYFDPRLAVDLRSLMNSAESLDVQTRRRLVEILSDRPHGAIGFDVILGDSGTNFRGRNRNTSWWAEPDVGKINVDRFSNTRPLWTRAVRGMVLLEHIGTPDARAIVDAMATGHPDAQATRVARDLIAARAR